MKKVIFLIFITFNLSFSQEKKLKVYNPKKATTLSAILPGLGQVYNKQYWKLPIIYGGYAVIGHYIKFNNDMYHEFREALTFEIDNNTSTLNPFPNFSKNSLERNMEFQLIKILYMDLTVLKMPKLKSISFLKTKDFQNSFWIQFMLLS